MEWYSPLKASITPYDIVYVSKIFNFSPDYPFPIIAKEIIRGGTGYDIHSHLPQDIDDTQPDFSIYPSVPSDTSYGFLTRGCPNRCPWCVVPRKEGAIRPYWDIDRVANGRKKIVLMDNNILAAGDYAIHQLDTIISRGYRIDFNQALDARLVTEEFAIRLARIRWLGSRIRFGCDTHTQIAECQRAIDLINSHGFRGEYFLYTMIGGRNDFPECYQRINYWRDKIIEHRTTHQGRATYAYAQPYRDPTNPHHIIPQWQKDLAQWCNKRMLYTTIPFHVFSPRKGFTCQAYLDQYGITPSST